jgi:hypothetical protein
MSDFPKASRQPRAHPAIARFRTHAPIGTLEGAVVPPTALRSPRTVTPPLPMAGAETGHASGAAKLGGGEGAVGLGVTDGTLTWGPCGPQGDDDG